MHDCSIHVSDDVSNLIFVLIVQVILQVIRLPVVHVACGRGGSSRRLDRCGNMVD